ncbi:uncharacterized protein LOC117647238 [Thrips palmi]|uniref:Uncharacterized protein LOC117647238 n=1 Tax=Thrips palmi TaxID=161013 RepID=A0A6P8ZPW3_THRPL|nr:uncharacterized protein LOC117647238 [Thrips palmi]
MEDAWLLLVLVAAAGVELGRTQPVVRSIGSISVQHDNVQVLGQTENCKSVSIPATTMCGPGLECSPASGTCVPVRQRPSQYQNHPEKLFRYNKLSLKNQGRQSFNSLSQTDDKPLKSPWSFSWNKGAIRL